MKFLIILSESIAREIIHMIQKAYYTKTEDYDVEYLK